MTFKNKIYFIILGLVGQLFFLGQLSAEPLESGDNALGQEISRSASSPEQHRLTLVSVYPLVVEGEIVGQVAVYDDATTNRLAGYSELYDSIGDLLAFDWFDRFGIRRLAIDEGLVEEKGELEGVFVVFLEGESM